MPTVKSGSGRTAQRAEGSAHTWPATCFGSCRARAGPNHRALDRIFDPGATCSTLSKAHRWNSLCKSSHALGFPNHLAVLASGGPTKLKRDGRQLLINYHELVDHPSTLNSTEFKTVQSVGIGVAVLKTILYVRY